MEGRLEVLEYHAPIAVAGTMALVDDDEIEVIRRVLLEHSAAARVWSVKPLVDPEVQVVIEWSVPSRHHPTRLVERGELVIGLVAQVYTIREEQNLLRVARL